MRGLRRAQAERVLERRERCRLVWNDSADYPTTKAFAAERHQALEDRHNRDLELLRQLDPWGLETPEHQLALLMQEALRNQAMAAQFGQQPVVNFGGHPWWWKCP